jgi:hypothetical protein
VKNMTDYDFKNDDSLNNALDAALTQYAAVEPRAGLEERILANLETGRFPVVRWWGWAAAAAFAAAIVFVALALVWRSGPRPSTLARHTPPVTQTPEHSGTTTPQNGRAEPLRSSHPASVRKSTTHSLTQWPATAAAVPRLDQFPSPQPLSEQEKILASYVVSYPQHAALLALAHAEDLRQDLADDVAKHRAAPAGDSPQ